MGVRPVSIPQAVREVFDDDSEYKRPDVRDKHGRGVLALE